MSEAVNFDPKAVVVNFMGAVDFSGYASGDDVISVEPVGEDATRDTGVDGLTVWTESGERDVYTITIKLSGASATNAKLSAIRESKVGPGPFVIVDTKGTTLFAGTQVRIIKPPKYAIGGKVGEREWTFEGVGKFFVGGN